MPAEEPVPLEDRHQKSRPGPGQPLADRFAVWVGFGLEHQQRQESGRYKGTATAGAGDGVGRGAVAPSAEAVLVVPKLFEASERRHLLAEDSSESSADRGASPQPPAVASAQRAAAAVPAANDDLRFKGTYAESVRSAESSVDSFESADGLLFPDGAGALGFADAEAFSAAGTAEAEEVGEFMSIRLGEGSAEAVWIMSRTARALSVLAFWASHTCSVYATKALLSRPGRTIRSVVLVTWCQCLASFILVLTLGTLGERQDSKKGAWRSGLLTEMARALPTNPLLGGWNSKSLLGGGAEAVGLASVFFCLAVFADNACLGVVNASFFQVARALTLPLVTFMGAVGARALPPRDLLLPCVLCVAGFSLGVHSQTPEAFADGTSMGVMASLLTAAYTRLLARAEPREAWRVTYVTNRNASVILVPVAVYVGMGDPDDLDLATDNFFLKDGPTFFLAVMATILPAVAGVCTMWQAQARLGARGLAASSVGRAAFSHLMAFYVFGNSKVLIGEIGCALVLTGLALYASCRGGAAVAQAGNVAVPGAAREHFVPSSAVPAVSASASPADPGPITKVCRPVKRKTSSRFKERVASSAFGGAGDAGDHEGDGGAAVLEGGMGMGIGMVDVGRGASTETHALPQGRGSAGGTHVSSPSIDAALLAEENGAGSNNGLHARRLSPKQRERVGSGSAGWNRREAPS
eukprot:g8451.t1